MHKKAEILNLKEDQSLQGGEPLVLPEEVGLHSGEYKKLFGGTFGEEHESKPWKRGIVRVCGEKKIKNTEKGGSEASRKIVILLRFRGYNQGGATKEKAYLHPLTAARLGVTSDSGSEGKDLWLGPSHGYCSCSLQAGCARSRGGCIFDYLDSCRLCLWVKFPVFCCGNCYSEGERDGEVACNRITRFIRSGCGRNRERFGDCRRKIRRLGVRAHKLLSEWMTGLIPFEKIRTPPVGQERHIAKATIFARNRMYGLRAKAKLISSQ